MDAILDVDVFSDEDEDDIFEVARRPYIIKYRPNYMEEMDDTEFYARFRLKRETVTILYQQIEEHLQVLWNQNRSVTPINKLLLALRFYATGSFLQVAADFSGVCTSTASRTVRKVSTVIASLRPQIIKAPNTEVEVREIQQGFYEMYNFPRVIGCVDCTHIRIQSPGGDQAEVFRNRKGYFSLNTQVVCDHNLRAIDVVARWPGSSHDATIFNNSAFKHKMEQNLFGNGILLGDSAYPLQNYLLTPVANPQTQGEVRYNFAHVRTRNIIERFFGVWKRRFPVLSMGMRIKIQTVQDIIIATAVLNNIARNEGEEPPIVNVDMYDEVEADIPPAAGQDNNAFRQTLINNYFTL
ncbi:hypothetical protein MML48_10g00014645 [Holotrichia oblita]|uniref:Uncharacterized protein n=1 Tax=Holotrichia oblita TaxID=644536 RepID=A0ACB9SFY7_HOLOL|nr:hypothetical protein MML48_10g00014645 [Holotrichia oblita]